MFFINLGRGVLGGDGGGVASAHVFDRKVFDERDKYVRLATVSLKFGTADWN